MPSVYTCELCDKQFATRQAKSMHKQRLHPSGTMDTSDIDKRMSFLMNRIRDDQKELEGLHAKRMQLI
jgi:Zinc-finger of C2H2 type